MEIDFLNDLNESQRLAVEYCEGPSLVIAGAGSGKTRVLTYKIAYLLARGLSPWGVLALTFTNKAAREMRERISKLVSESDARALWMGTFHSIFARILRMECTSIGYTSDFTIYDAQDAQSLVKQIVKEKGLDDKKYKPGMVAARISEAKNNMVTPEQYAQSYETVQRDRLQQAGEIHSIYTTYQQRLRNSNAMDFDDLLLNTYRLLKCSPEIREKYGQRFRYVLVDEYQDTNRVQHEIVKLLTEGNQRVCVVGDDAQSIYSFRGAVIDNILDFQNLYPNTKLFKLERNYRSTQTIVQAANSLINHNRHQIHKDVYSEKEVGEPIDVLEAFSDKEEASMVMRKLSHLKRHEGLQWSDFAILYRTNSQSRTFEEEFRRQGMPYRIVGGFSFYQRKEVKDAVAYLRLAVNPNDETALRRIINVPARGIGATTVERVGQAAEAAGVSMWQVVAQPETYAPALNAGTRGKLAAFARMIQTAGRMAEEQDAYEVANYIVKESGLWQSIMDDKTIEGQAAQQYMQELMDGIDSYVNDAVETGESTSLTQYLQDISLLSDTEEGDEQDDNKITLMTVHSAKGLEFPVVFVVGMEEGLFPSERLCSEREVEEERRLFYVAITRAERTLFISWSRTRIRYGQFNNCTRSRFISEVDEKYLNTGSPKGRSLLGGFNTMKRPFQGHETPVSRPCNERETATSVRPTGIGSLKPMRSVTSNYTAQAPLQGTAATLQVGSRIKHVRFGEGVVCKIEGTGLDTKATVEFENLGTKQLLLRFSKYEVMD